MSSFRPSIAREAAICFHVVAVLVVLCSTFSPVWAQTVVAPQTIVRVPGFLPDTDKYSMSQDNYAFVWAKETLVTLDGGQQQITYNPIATQWALSIPQDTNGNRIQDDGEDWSETLPEYGAGVWQFRKDLSCWAASANNLAQTITGINYYYQWMYDDGVTTPLSLWEPNYWYSGGDQPHECLDEEDLANDTEYAENMLNGFWMSNPEYYLWRHLDGGKPVAASVEWDLFEGHAFTIYGIDTINHRLWVVDSDSDKNGDEPYWMDYRWHESGSGGFFQGNWGGEWFDMNTFCSFETNKWAGYDDNFSTTSNWNGYPDWDVWEINGGGAVHVRGNESRPKRLVVQGIEQNLVIDNTGTLNLKTFMLSNEAQMDIYGRMNVIHQQTIDGVVNLYDGGVWDNTVGTTVVAAQQDGVVDQWGGEATIWKLVLSHERTNQYFELNRGYYNVLGGTLNAGEVVVGYEGWGELGLKPGTQLLRNTAAYAGEFSPQYHPDNSYIMLGQGKQAHGNLYMDPSSVLETNRLVVGGLGTGYFEQRGGVATILDDLIVGEDAWFDDDWNLLRSYGQVKLLGDSVLHTTRTVVGQRGRGWFLQDGTSVHDTDELIIGNLTKDGLKSIGEYDMKGGTLGAGKLVIGSIGDGVFRQMGGQTIAGEVIVGQWSGDGRLTLSAGSLSADSLHLKRGEIELLGTGGVIVNGESLLEKSVTQDDESVFVTQSLSLSSTSGQYTLNDGRISVVNDAALYDGARFTQWGGVHTIGGTLTVEGDGVYKLDDGSLLAARAMIGRDGIGSMTHNAGQAEFSLGLVLGERAGSTGYYVLRGGALRTPGMVVGDLGGGDYLQVGGTLDVAEGVVECALANGSTGKFRFHGGTLIADTLDLHTRGEFGTNGQGTLRLNQAFLNDSDGKALGDISVQTLQIGHNGRDDDTTLALGINQNIQAEDVMIGYNLAHHITDVQMSQGAKITTEHMYLGYGQNTVGRITLDKLQTGLVADYLHVGYSGEGSIAQSKGVTSVPDALYVGFMPGSTGQFTLSGGMVVAGDEAIGVLGDGAMTQSGGTNNVTGSLFIGYGPSGDGRYILNGGTLNAAEILVGRNGGKGSLRIDPTSVLNAGRIVVSANGRVDGWRSWVMSQTLEVAGGNLVMDTDCELDLVGDSMTILSGGNIVADDVRLGGDGTMLQTAEFQQSGGALYANTELIVGPNGTNLGLYTMTGGEMTTGHFMIGNRAPGRMEQSGGTVEASQQVSIGSYNRGDGVYELSGGSLRTPSLEFGGEGKGVFNWTGGDLFTDMVRLRAQCEMNVDVDWVFSGEIRAIGGTLAMAENTLTLVNATEDFDNPTRLSIGVGRATIGELSVLALSEYVQSNQATSIIDQLTINSGTVSITGGTLTSDRVVVAKGSPLPYVYHGGLYDQTGGTVNADEFIVSDLHNTQGQAYLSGTGQLNTNTMRIGIQSYGQFYQSGGIHRVLNTLSVGESFAVEDLNRYILDDGELQTGRTCVGTVGWAEFRQGGGLHHIATSLDIGSQGIDLGHQASGSYELKGGRLEVPAINVEGDVASRSWAGLSLGGGELQTQSIRIGQNGNLYTQSDWSFTEIAIDVDGGTVNQEYGLTLLNSAVSMRNGEWYGDALRLESSHRGLTTFSGYGYVELWGELHNAGRIVADGFGEERLLDFSQVAGISRDESSSGRWGWFAQNQGVLQMPVQMIEGDGLFTVGDCPDAEYLALTNSVRADFAGVDGSGLLSVQLLAADSLGLDQLDAADLLGVWNFGLESGVEFDTAVLTFRYDYLALAELGRLSDDLRVFHYDGTQWQDVTGGLDLAHYCIYTTVVDGFSLYAVAAVPEPGLSSYSVIVFLFALRRQRGKSIR